MRLLQLVLHSLLVMLLELVLYSLAQARRICNSSIMSRLQLVWISLPFQRSCGIRSVPVALYTSRAAAQMPAMLHGVPP